jgi:SAM-dependent methyltransferase
MKHQLDAGRYDTDKSALGHYEEYFQPLADREVRLLELGVYRGGSLLMWRDFFERGLIVGLDLEPVRLDDPTGRIRLYRGRQEDTELLSRIAVETAPQGFDIIIDDCSHIGELTRISFWHLFDRHLKPGGIYVIEDWGTGYWECWRDGVGYRPRRRARPQLRRTRLICAIARLQSSPAARRIPLAARALHLAKVVLGRGQFAAHNFGMAGFVKELVDEAAMADITAPGGGVPPPRRSKFKELRIADGRVFVVKAG